MDWNSGQAKLGSNELKMLYTIYQNDLLRILYVIVKFCVN